MNDERDPVVADALGAVPVPEHHADFWARLDAAVAAEPVPRAQPRPGSTPAAVPPRPSPPAPTPPPVLDLPPAAGRRGRRVDRRWVAAAAAVVVLGGAALGARVVADDDAGTPTTSAFGTEVTAPPGDVPPSSVAAAPSAADAAAEFLDRLGSGDVAGARAMVGPLSIDYLQASTGDVDAFLREAVEGYGAWVGSTDRTFTTVALDPGDAVVLVRGNRPEEGVLVERLHAIPMVQAPDGTWQVELWASEADVQDAEVAIVAPEPIGPIGALEGGAARYALRAGDVVTVIGKTAGRVWLSVDGAAAQPVDVTGATWRTDVAVAQDPQRDGVLLVAFRSPTGFEVLPVFAEPREAAAGGA